MRIFGKTGAGRRLAATVSDDAVEGAQHEAVATPAPIERPDRPVRLLFILSTERSGSTLLSVVLGANRRHVSPPEMHLMAYPTFDEWRRRYPAALDSLRFLLAACDVDDRDDEAIERRFAGWTSESIYRWFLDGALPDEQLFIDKTPKYARSPEVLARIESLEPHYIWLVRHPLAVAASQVELRRERRLERTAGLTRGPRRWIEWLRERLARRRILQEEVGYWCTLNRHIERFLAGVEPRRFVRVSFERFVRDPEPVLRELCDWLGSDFDAAMLDPAANIPAGMQALTGDPKVHRHARIDPRVADSWRDIYSESDLDERTLTLMRRWNVI